MNHEGCACASAAFIGSEISNCRSRHGRADVIQNKLYGQRFEEIVEANSITDIAPARLENQMESANVNRRLRGSGK
jgi:hypothetical protein